VALVEHEPLIVHTAKLPEPKIPKRVTCPDYAKRLPRSIAHYTTQGVYDATKKTHLSFTQGSGHAEAIRIWPTSSPWRWSRIAIRSPTPGSQQLDLRRPVRPSVRPARRRSGHTAGVSPSKACETHRAPDIPAVGPGGGQCAVDRASVRSRCGRRVPPSERITLGVLGLAPRATSTCASSLEQGCPRHRSLRCQSAEPRRRAEAVAEAYGSPDVKAFADFRALNADRSIDAVLMALPVHWHTIPLWIAVSERQTHYHEKPMASPSPRRVVSATRCAAGVVFQFGTQQRSDRAFRWACQLARSGRLARCAKSRSLSRAASTDPPSRNSPFPTGSTGTAGSGQPP